MLKHKAIFVEALLIIFFPACHQNKRPRVGGAIVHLHFYGVIAPTTAYTREYFSDVKITQIYIW